MALDVSLGNIPAEEAERLANAAGSVDDVPHESGSTEPWISRLIADFIIARGARTVLETGCFKGATSVWILDALQRLGGGTMVVCEIDEPRRIETYERLEALRTHPVTVDILMCGDVMRGTHLQYDLAFVDDDHTKAHVTKELQLLYPKMAPGGLILLHDVYGSCDLKTVVQQFGGYSIDLPRLGPAGGLGLIQVP